MNTNKVLITVAIVVIALFIISFVTSPLGNAFFTGISSERKVTFKTQIQTPETSTSGTKKDFGFGHNLQIRDSCKEIGDDVIITRRGGFETASSSCTADLRGIRMPICNGPYFAWNIVPCAEDERCNYVGGAPTCIPEPVEDSCVDNGDNTVTRVSAGRTIYYTLMCSPDGTTVQRPECYNGGVRYVDLEICTPGECEYDNGARCSENNLPPPPNNGEPSPPICIDGNVWRDGILEAVCPFGCEYDVNGDAFCTSIISN